MKYTIEILPPALKALKSLDTRYVQKIKERIDLLATDPRHMGSIKLAGQDAYRTRVGRYRILYKVLDKIVHVIVINIDHRKDVSK